MFTCLPRAPINNTGNTKYKHYLNDLQSHDNALLMGDVNICRYDDDDTYLPAENVNKGIKQIINSYTYVTARSPNGRQRPESCIDHIYTVYTHGVDVVESGVVHTGISDHTLIFCTIQPENSDDVESEDTLQHDVPQLLAALVGSGPSSCEDMWVKCPKFWILARRMETKRIELSELIKGIDAHGNREKLKNKKTNPVRFCEDLKGELEELDIIPFESIIDRVKEGSSYRHPGSVSLIEELEWYLYSGVRRNLLKGTIFLSSRSTYLNFCFPRLQSQLPAEDHQKAIRVINPSIL